MKNSTDTNIPRETTTSTESTMRTSHWPAGSSQLRLLVAAVAVTAAWLCYQAVNETIVLHRSLDQVHAVTGEAPLAKAPASLGSNITETNSRVAGL